jgi:hypothetical protein
MAAAEASQAPVLEVPATTPWGMLVMALLVLTASTVAMYGMYGGGIPQRSWAGPAPGPVRSEPEREEPRPARPKRLRAWKPRPTFDRRRQQDPSIRHNSTAVRQLGRSSRSKKRRDGPGIRG